MRVRTPLIALLLVACAVSAQQDEGEGREGQQLGGRIRLDSDAYFRGLRDNRDHRYDVITGRQSKKLHAEENDGSGGTKDERDVSNDGESKKNRKRSAVYPPPGGEGGGESTELCQFYRSRGFVPIFCRSQAVRSRLNRALSLEDDDEGAPEGSGASESSIKGEVSNDSEKLAELIEGYVEDLQSRRNEAKMASEEGKEAITDALEQLNDAVRLHLGDGQESGSLPMQDDGRKPKIPVDVGQELVKMSEIDSAALFGSLGKPMMSPLEAVASEVEGGEETRVQARTNTLVGTAIAAGAGLALLGLKSKKIQQRQRTNSYGYTPYNQQPAFAGAYGYRSYNGGSSNRPQDYNPYNQPYLKKRSAFDMTMMDGHLDGPGARAFEPELLGNPEDFQAFHRFLTQLTYRQKRQAEGEEESTISKRQTDGDENRAEAVAGQTIATAALSNNAVNSGGRLTTLAAARPYPLLPYPNRPYPPRPYPPPPYPPRPYPPRPYPPRPYPQRPYPPRPYPPRPYPPYPRPWPPRPSCPYPYICPPFRPSPVYPTVTVYPLTSPGTYQGIETTKEDPETSPVTDTTGDDSEPSPVAETIGEDSEPSPLMETTGDDYDSSRRLNEQSASQMPEDQYYPAFYPDVYDGAYSRTDSEDELALVVEDLEDELSKLKVDNSSESASGSRKGRILLLATKLALLNYYRYWPYYYYPYYYRPYYRPGRPFYPSYRGRLEEGIQAQEDDILIEGNPKVILQGEGELEQSKDVNASAAASNDQGEGRTLIAAKLALHALFHDYYYPYYHPYYRRYYHPYYRQYYRPGRPFYPYYNEGRSLEGVQARSEEGENEGAGADRKMRSLALIKKYLLKASAPSSPYNRPPVYPPYPGYQPLPLAPQPLPPAPQPLPPAPQPLPQAPQPLPLAPQPLPLAPQPSLIASPNS